MCGSSSTATGSDSRRGVCGWASATEAHPLVDHGVVAVVAVVVPLPCLPSLLPLPLGSARVGDQPLARRDGRSTR
jgi:hypothetical protein